VSSRVPQQKLLRILGVTFGIAVTVGGTVGVGILRTPGMVASHIPDPWFLMVLWLFGGIYALLGTLCVIELGTMLPQAGGWYIYSRRAFGDYVGFAVGWCDWIMQCAALGYLVTALGEFSVALYPALPGGIKGIAVATLCLFAFLHWLGIRSSSRLQEITSLAKGIALFAFVVACFYANPAEVDVQAVTIPTGFPLIVVLVLALQSIIITYDGWYSAIYFTEEDKNPAENLPKSAIGGLIFTIVIYLLINAALIYALPISQLAGSTLPAATVAEKIFGPAGGRIITAISLISLFSVINAVVLITTRILYGLGRDRLFFTPFERVSKAGTPLPALVVTTIAGILLVLTGTFERLIAIAAFFNVIVYTSGFLSLFILRKKHSELPRPFRVWGYPWTPLIALIGSIAFLIGTVFSDRENSFYGLILLALTYPLFKWTSRSVRRAERV
jgi:basic amino acid/polyamine antiporter, APA family